MNRTKIIGTVVITVFVVGLLLFAICQNKTTSTPVVTENDTTAIEKETIPASITNQVIDPIVVTNIPEGWTTYTNDEKRFGFAYPANWEIHFNWKAFLKNRDAADQFGHVQVVGDGYQFGVTYLEHESDTNQFGFVEVYGDGSHLTMSSLDRGYGRDAVIQKMVPDIYISGKKAKAWETTFGLEIKLLVVVPECNNLSFFIENFTSTSSDLLYQLISTAVCE